MDVKNTIEAGPFEQTIKHLQSEIRARRDMANDKTGVLTEYTKRNMDAQADEFERAIAVLKASKATYEQIDL